MFDFLQYGFMQRAIIAGLAVSLAAPMMGVFLVSKKLSLITDTLAHIALVGVAIGLLLKTSPLLMVVVITVAASIVIEWLRSNQKIPGDAVLGLLLPVGLAVAVLVAGIGGANTASMSVYLFGSIAGVSQDDLVIIVAATMVTSVLVLIWFRQMFFVSFDSEAAKLAGLPVKTINLLMATLTAILVAVSIRVIGALLISALMVMPVLAAARIANSFQQTFLLAVGFSVVGTLVGLIGAYYLSTAAGATIVMSQLLIFVGASLFAKLR